MTTSVTASLTPETVALMDRVAKANGKSRESFAAEAIRRVAEHEADFLDFVQTGIDEADRGDLTPHDQVMRELDDRIEQHRLKWRA